MRFTLLGLLVACSSTNSTAKPPAKIMDGVQIVYSADLDAAVDEKASEIARGLRSELGALAEVRSTFTPLGGLTVRVADPARRAEVDAIIKKRGSVIAMRECAGEQAICMKITDEHAQALRVAAVDEAVAVIRKRIASGGLRATVAANGTSVVVDLGGTDQEAFAYARDVIARVGRLELRAIDNNSAYMTLVVQQVEADKAAQEPRLGMITARTDEWRGAKGAIESDSYLVEHDRQRLRTYVEELACSDPRFLVPDDRQLGYEELHGESSWRTHFLVRDGGVSARTIQSAKSQRDSATGNIAVVIELDKVGAAELQAMSANSVGKKIAVMIDQRVMSAPIVAAPLGGGRFTITLGGRSDRQQRDADELVAVLRGGALPAPMREETVSELRGGKVIPPPAE